MELRIFNLPLCNDSECLFFRCVVAVRVLADDVGIGKNDLPRQGLLLVCTVTV